VSLKPEHEGKKKRTYKTTIASLVVVCVGEKKKIQMVFRECENKNPAIF